MQNIRNSKDLALAIQHLEIKQQVEWIALKTEMQNIAKEISPFNILKHTYKDVLSNVGVKEKIIGVLMGLTAGFLSKKCKLSDIFMQWEVSTLVNQNASKIIAFVKNIFNAIRNR